MSLTEIANRHGTDKGTVTGQVHSYSCVYGVMLAPLRERELNLMEIGLNTREPVDVPSVKMWHEFFPRAHIYGVDIRDFSGFESDFFSFFRADCGDPEALEAVVNEAPQCDVIIDDGSHASYHQQLTLLKLFPLVKSGGLYIIEDLDWQPDGLEKALPRVPKTRDLLATFMRDGEFTRTGAIDRDDWASLEKGIETITLFDKRSLGQMGRFFNVAHGHETAANGLVAKSVELAKYVYRDVNPLRRPNVKLAIMQKK